MRYNDRIDGIVLCLSGNDVIGGGRSIFWNLNQKQPTHYIITEDDGIGHNQLAYNI